MTFTQTEPDSIQLSLEQEESDYLDAALVQAIEHLEREHSHEPWYQRSSGVLARINQRHKLARMALGWEESGRQEARLTLRDAMATALRDLKPEPDPDKDADFILAHPAVAAELERREADIRCERNALRDHVDRYCACVKHSEAREGGAT